MQLLWWSAQAVIKVHRRRCQGERADEVKKHDDNNRV